MQYQAPLGSTDPNASYAQGSPAAGVRGSFIPAAAVEQPMRELMAIIGADPSLTPSNGDLGQALKAIRYLIASAVGAINFPAVPQIPEIPGAGEGNAIDANGNIAWNIPGLTEEDTIGDGDFFGFYQSAVEGGQAAGHARKVNGAALASYVLAKQTSGVADLGAYIASQAYTSSQIITLAPTCQAFRCRIWASGAGGANGGGNGGGGGEYVEGSYAVPAGAELSLVVGAPGAPGGDGNQSSITLVANEAVLVFANGGQNGDSGGAGGSNGGGGQIHIPGQPGLPPLANGLYFPGIGGGAFGCGSNVSTGNVQGGTAFGQGGTGANPVAGQNTAGPGGRALIIIDQLIVGAA